MRWTALLMTLPAIVATAGEVREEILVTVNNHVITRRTFQQAVEQSAAALYRQFSGQELDDKLVEARDEALQGMVDECLLEDKASDLGIAVTDEILEQYLEDIKKKNNFATDTDLDQALRTSLGIGLKEYRKHARRQMLQQEVLRREVYSKTAVEEEELLAYYEVHKAEYKAPSRYRIRELVLSKGTTSEEKAAVERTLQEIQNDLKGGKSFESAIKAHSTSPTRSTGGDLGWLTRGVLRPAIEETALAMKMDQVSAPIESDKDITLIQLIGAEAETVRPFSEVRASILETLQEPKAQTGIQTYLSQLRSRATIRYMIPKRTILKG